MLPDSDQIQYFVGDEDVLTKMSELPVEIPFSPKRVDFLNEVSREILADSGAKIYPDVVTFAFWIRRANLERQRLKFVNDDLYRLGRGIVFHIAPSNVAVNYAYSFAAGFIMGNANIVRLPSKNYLQVTLINQAIQSVLKKRPEYRPYICMIRYKRNKEINDFLSAFCDVRIIWGGDITISEVRKSPLRVRATEITFADRYSFSVIDSNVYMEQSDKKKIAKDFYNDTYLTDQNACTSPHLVCWTGTCTDEAKKIFWDTLFEILKQSYDFQNIQGIDKLTNLYLAAIHIPNLKKENNLDNLLVRVSLDKLTPLIRDFRGNSGFFYEYEMEDITELSVLCDERVQTISYIGSKEMFAPLLHLGVKGIDRIVLIGQTMNFGLIWDGYNLVERLSREIDL